VSIDTFPPLSVNTSLPLKEVSCDDSSLPPDAAWQSRYSTPTGRLNALLRHAAHSDLTVVFPATGKAYKVEKTLEHGKVLIISKLKSMRLLYPYLWSTSKLLIFNYVLKIHLYYRFHKKVGYMGPTNFIFNANLH